VVFLRYCTCCGVRLSQDIGRAVVNRIQCLNTCSRVSLESPQEHMLVMQWFLDSRYWPKTPWPVSAWLVQKLGVIFSWRQVLIRGSRVWVHAPFVFVCHSASHSFSVAAFHSLRRSGKLMVLPSIWNPCLSSFFSTSCRWPQYVTG